MTLPAHTRKVAALLMEMARTQESRRPGASRCSST